jgi:glycine hydroxymethyltransferase
MTTAVQDLKGVDGMPGSEIATLLEQHERLREGGINLVASENRISPRVRRALASDLAGRYQDAGYGGSIFSRKLVEATEGLAKKLFESEHALVSPVSGNLCVLAAVAAFTAPGDAVAMLPFTAGGYPFGIEKFHRRRVDIPADEGSLSIDVDKTVSLLAGEKVGLAFLGASFIPFPHPVEEIRQGLREAGHHCLLVYDGSHVLGLIACGEFQDPLREGADILIGSTHKTFYGPQGGLILTASPQLAVSMRKMLELDLEEGIGLVDNPHLNRIAALGLALEEMLEDRGYGNGVVANSRALARALDEQGVPVRFRDRGYTESHQVFLDLGGGEAEKLCRSLETVRIFIDAWGRMGTAEVTHAGMGPEEMRTIASCISRTYRGEPNDDVADIVRGLCDSFACA